MPEISIDTIDYTVAQLAILAALNHSEAGTLASIYANTVLFNDTALEASVGLHIEVVYNETLYRQA